MLVKLNREDGFVYVPFTPKTEEGASAIITVSAGVTLSPGWNEIPDESFNNCLKAFETLEDEGKVEIHAKRTMVDGVASYDGKPIDEVHAVTARKIIEGCFDVALLKKWKQNAKLSSEGRHLVDMQLEKIDKEGKA